MTRLPVENTGARVVRKARLMQWLAPLATPSASVRRGPTPKAKRRHDRVEKLGGGDDMTGTAWGRIGTLATGGSGLVLRGSGSAAVDGVEIPKGSDGGGGEGWVRRNDCDWFLTIT